MNKFKVGDKIRCIIESKSLIKNNIYTIKGIQPRIGSFIGHYLSLEEKGGKGLWWCNRFELEEPLELQFIQTRKTRKLTI